MMMIIKMITMMMMMMMMTEMMMEAQFDGGEFQLVPLSLGKLRALWK